ncbi:hypothetical protein HK101_010110 [Irineochytrium annulatum]|nr:hypothetical protein HK101_010110 [Irineochytrium annulatum]
MSTLASPWGRLSSSPLLIAVLAGAASVAALAPFEPADGQLLWGPWYDQYVGDTPAAIHSRINAHLNGTAVQPYPSFYQMNFHIDTYAPITENNKTIPIFAAELDASNTDAILYVTVDPEFKVDTVSDDAINTMAQQLKAVADSGRRVFLRYAHEMNGNWVPFGGLPASYVPHFQKVYVLIYKVFFNVNAYACPCYSVTKVRSVVGASRIAIVWAPNSCNGYPFGGQANITAADLALLDTNKNGQVDSGDNAFDPFYPGDDYVDWVGLSMYDYGAPKYTNSPTQLDMFEGFMNGEASRPSDQRSNWQPCGFDFYDMYSASNSRGQSAISKGGKPFMAAETSKAFYLTSVSGEATANEVQGLELGMKQAWWREALNKTLVGMYPKYKGLCFFDLWKVESSEGLTELRQYQVLNDTNGVLAAFVPDLLTLLPGVVFGNVSTAAKTTTAVAATGTNGVTPTWSAGTPEVSSTVSAVSTTKSGASAKTSGISGRDVALLVFLLAACFL